MNDAVAGYELTPPIPERPPRLAFVHVPKTGGTSITIALMRAYGGLTLPAMTTLDYRHYSPARLAEFRLYRGHAYRSDYSRLPADTALFTVLRDPVARAVSYFNFYRALDDSAVTDDFVLEASHLAKTASPVEFIYSDSPFIIEQIRLGQIRQFMPPEILAEVAHRQFLSRALRRRVVAAFLSEMQRFEFVLTCEMLPLSLPPMIAQLGLPSCCGALPRLNVSAACDGIDTADIRRALVDVNAAEFECYAYARQRETAFLIAALTAPEPQSALQAA